MRDCGRSASSAGAIRIEREEVEAMPDGREKELVLAKWQHAKLP